MMLSATSTPLSFEVAIDRTQADAAVDVMHRAFAELSGRGGTSSALIETVATLRDEMERGTDVGLVSCDGAPIAVVKHRADDAGLLYFSRLGVLPEHRGGGIAAAVVHALRRSARERGLGGLSCAVRADETRNIALYERLGMRVTREYQLRSSLGVIRTVVDMADAPVAVSAGE